MSVAGANKVEGTMSWCVGTNEILASNMTALKSQARALWERHLDLRNFFVFYYVWKCLEAQNWNIFMIQTLSRGVARIFQRSGGGGGSQRLFTRLYHLYKYRQIGSIYRKMARKIYLKLVSTRISVSSIPSGKTGLAFQMFCCSRKSSAGTTQKVFHLLSNRIFRKLKR